MAMRADHCAHRRFKDNDMTLDPRAARSAAQLDARCKVVLPIRASVSEVSVIASAIS
jgi:hypothetical protein